MTILITQIISSIIIHEAKSQVSFIKDCFESHGKILFDELEIIGFSANQCIDFLPEVASEASRLFNNLTANQAEDRILAGNFYHLLDTTNVEQIMRTAGLNSEQITSGFNVIMPYFYYHFKKME